MIIIEDVSLSSHGGNIVFNTLDAKNGDITGSIIESYDDYSISCNSKKGENNLPSSKLGRAKSLTVSNNKEFHFELEKCIEEYNNK